jgi:hypothetical protein
MLKRSIRIVSFILLFSLIFSILNCSMKVVNPRWQNFYHLPKDSLDVVFMGNSHSFTSFQPVIIDDILPVNSYAIGVGAENIVLSYYELKEILKTQHPKAVVLETFAVDLDDTNLQQTYYYEFLDSGVWDGNKAVVAARYITPDKSYTIFPALRTRIDWTNPDQPLSQLVDQTSNLVSPEVDPMGGASPLTNVMEDNKYQEVKAEPTRVFKSPAESNRIYLQKFYQLCRQNGIQLVLATTPMVNAPPNKTGKYAPFDLTDFLRQTGVPLEKFEDFGFNHLHFANTDHVNEFGSVVVSIQMAQKLAGILGLPIDQSALEYYRSFIFTDYKIIQDGDLYTIELIPAGSGLTLEYNWEVLSGDDVVSKSGPQKESKYQFQLKESGAYQIWVEIVNPEGACVIKAKFNLVKEV